MANPIVSKERIRAEVERFKDHEDAGPRGEMWQSDEFLAELAQARTALSEAKAGGWQPIETAPKDGTEVLCWRDDCGQFIASYTSMDAMPLTQDEIDATDEETLFAKDWFTQWPQSIRLDGIETPTKWQPLPAPPAQRGEG